MSIYAIYVIANIEILFTFINLSIFASTYAYTMTLSLITLPKIF